MMNDYYNADPSLVKVNEPRETVKDVLSGTDKLMVETYELLCEMCEALMGRDERAGLPDLKDATMMATMMRQRAQMENIRSLVVRMRERLY